MVPVRAIHLFGLVAFLWVGALTLSAKEQIAEIMERFKGGLMTCTEERRRNEVIAILSKYNLKFDLDSLYTVVLKLEAENNRFKEYLEKRGKQFRLIAQRMESIKGK